MCYCVCLCVCHCVLVCHNVWHSLRHCVCHCLCVTKPLRYVGKKFKIRINTEIQKNMKYVYKVKKEYSKHPKSQIDCTKPLWKEKKETINKAEKYTFIRN